jgi:glycosyltransferase involved in cell wall biosynthesis
MVEAAPPDRRARRIVLLYAGRGTGFDGIRDYSNRLEAELRRGGTEAHLLPGTAGFGRPGPLFRPELKHADAVVIQYNPFSYARWGFAPWLPLAARRLRAGRGGPAIALMIHEPYVPISGFRQTLIGAWQRVQLRALRVYSDVVLSSIEQWSRPGCRVRIGPDVVHLPVASNLPDCRPCRQAERARLGAGSDTIVLAAFGGSHPSRLMDRVVDAANAVATTKQCVILLNLGGEAPALENVDRRVRVVVPGSLDDDTVARHLSATDVFVAPFGDGVSTRRTSVMAALQHELAVVATDGPLTDSVLRNAGDAIRLVPVADREGFSLAVSHLANCEDDRLSLAHAGRVLYEQSFDWPVLVGNLLDALDLAGRSNGRS